MSWQIKSGLKPMSPPLPSAPCAVSWISPRREHITLMPGAKTLVATLRARGAYTVLVSGGFTFFTSAIAQQIGFHAQHGNTLEWDQGALTGQVVEPILGKEAKQHWLQHYAQQKGLTLAQTLAVGDGANDLPMLQAAGLGVAYHAKPAVEAAAHAAIRHNDLTALLYLQGIAQSEWVEN
jgi:phosphoserine phosphatase